MITCISNRSGYPGTVKMVDDIDEPSSVINARSAGTASRHGRGPTDVARKAQV
jgi:hypothetical protein